MPEKIKVLFISQWYPHRYDPMFGLFVRKHAEAVNMYCDVQVLYVHADKNISDFEIVRSEKSGFSETYVYYPSAVSGLKKIFNYLKAYQKGFKIITSQGGKPDIIHANILTRTGFVAYILYKLNNIPYVITEHWSRYLPTRNTYKGFLRKLITKLVVRNASAILPVSKNLENAMIRHKLENRNYQVVNNVVDNHFFRKIALEKREKKRIIHISCFDETAKNIKGILRSLNKLSKVRSDFEVIFIGDGIDYIDVFNYATNLKLQKDVTFLGEKSPEEVAIWLQNSDFFVIFSNFENSPVVIAESLVCGKPVISSDVGGISELVNNENGLLVKAKDENALFNALNFMLDHYKDYNSQELKNIAKEKFSYESVGRKIFEIYKSILK